MINDGDQPMRDPDRIPQVLEKVARLWRMYPDWRLGQLTANVATWRDTDVSEIEEDELADEIDRHICQPQQASERGDCQ